MGYNISYEQSIMKSLLNTTKSQRLVEGMPKHTKILLQLSRMS